MNHLRQPAFLSACGAMLFGAVVAHAASTVFVSLPPCRIADTRVAGGPIAGATNRIFKVVGIATDFTSQGGAASGCGVPGFSGIVAQAQAIAVNIGAANHATSGFLTAFAGDTSRPLASTLNFSPGTTIANGVIVPVRQTAPEGSDLKVFVNATTDVFLDVTGYFTDITLVDGAGNGIDADMVDGFHASDLGDITGVTTGTGLSGGAMSGNASLSLNLAASNTWTGNTTFDPASGFALSTGTGDDINLGGNVRKGGVSFLHNNGSNNLGVGLNALVSNTTGSGNTATGANALIANSTGSYNTASGARALISNSGGSRNSASGVDALRHNTTGNQNTASGYRALYLNTIGFRNTASGAYALNSNTTGFRNIALGSRAGYNLTTGDDNIDIGNEGVAAEGATIRIGTTQTRAFITGIRGVTTGYEGAIPVVIDSNGQLGTAGGNVITGVAAGTGLSGGGSSGYVTLNLNLIASNTWTGNTTFNPASGFALATGAGDDINLGGNVFRGGTLFLHNKGTDNLGVGLNALASNTTGARNTASGASALFANTTGYRNTASGASALSSNTAGLYNTANGFAALSSNTTGYRNIALGDAAGFNLTTGSYNIDIGNEGFAAEAATIRIGVQGTQTATFIAGIAGATVSNQGSVLIDTVTGQLGTVVSSRRYKEDIQDMGSVSERLLKLRPVTFRYKPEVQAGKRPVEFGLIAEEVAQVFPELVVFDKQGRPETVKYHVLVPLLLNELQKQQHQAEEGQRAFEARLSEERRAREIDQEKLRAQVEEQKTETAEQGRKLGALVDRLAMIEKRARPEEPELARGGASRPGTTVSSYSESFLSAQRYSERGRP